MVDTNVLELSYLDLDEDMEEEPTRAEVLRNKTGIDDFEVFKKQFNVKEILDQMVIKREFFIPERAQNINEFYTFEKVRRNLKGRNWERGPMGRCTWPPIKKPGARGRSN